MSAFFVSRETIHDAVTAWCDVYRQPRDLDTLNSIGRSLWKMNAEALRQRYDLTGTPELAEYQRCGEYYCYRRPDVSDAQIAKSCRCLHYQCSEGNIGEGNARWDETYFMLGKVCDALGEPSGFDEALWDRMTA